MTITILLTLLLFAFLSNKYVSDYFNEYIDDVYLENTENIIEYAIAIGRGKYITSKELPSILQMEALDFEGSSLSQNSDYVENMSEFENSLENISSVDQLK